MGLPFGYSKCSRGGGGEPPKCPQWWNIQNRAAASRPGPDLSKKLRPAWLVGDILRPAPVATPRACKIPQRQRGLLPASSIMCVAGPSPTAFSLETGEQRRTMIDTDYYPVPLKQETLRPGTIYADPYGHVLVLAKRMSQSDRRRRRLPRRRRATRRNGGAQAFLARQFSVRAGSRLGGAGFKRFRPIVRDRNGTLRRLTNGEIAKNPQYGDFSLDQSKLGVEDFYDRMDDVMSPKPLDPLQRA